MDPRGGEFLTGASFTDQNHWSNRACDAGELLLKPEENLAGAKRLGWARSRCRRPNSSRIRHILVDSVNIN
jgi:hypothetical protein